MKLQSAAVDVQVSILLSKENILVIIITTSLR